MTWRYYAQRVRSSEWLDRDLQLQDVDLTWTLTGPGQLTALADANVAAAIGPDQHLVIDEYRTFIYAENNDQIEWGGIVTGSVDAGNGTRAFTCDSFTSYPKGRIWTGELSLYIADAFEMVRTLWDFVQLDEAGNIGMQVSNNLSGYILGSADPGPMPTQNPGESTDDYNARVLAWQTLINEPYELAWWNSPDCGNELDSIFEQSRTDYLERHEWDNSKEVVDHYLDLFAENRSNRRTELRFIEGENLKVAPLPERDGSEYANFVKGLGAGEDRHTLSFEAYAPDDGRLRRDKVYPAKNILVPATLAAETSQELRESQFVLKYDTIEVIDHPNAPIGSWSLGDEILIQTHSGFDKLYEWRRVVEWSMQPANPGSATLRVVSPYA